MRTWKTKNGCKIIQLLSGRSNAYLIITNSNIILVDTGIKSSFLKLSKKLDSLNITFGEISLLILTHTHFDHCQSAKEIKEKSDCKIIVSSFAEESIRNGYAALPNGTFVFTKLIAELGRWIGKRKFGLEPFYPDILIGNNGDLKVLGHFIKIIKTPGHSKDSMSILVDNEIAIVGDAMFGVFRNSIFPPYSDNVDKMIESWGKLLETDCSIFLPGHGSEISRQLLQKEYKKYNSKGV